MFLQYSGEKVAVYVIIRDVPLQNGPGNSHVSPCLPPLILAHMSYDTIAIGDNEVFESM
jgi:hypothetical protein